MVQSDLDLPLNIFRYLSKTIPLLLYPLGLACALVIVALFLHRGWWQKGLLILAFLCLFLGGNRWISFQLSKSLEWRFFPPPETVKADVIVVLASGAREAVFPRAIPEVGEVGDRLIYAAYLYQQGAAPFILHCGGEEAEGAEETSISGGEIPFLFGIMNVPTGAVLLETESRNTHENAVACSRMMKEKGFERAILVTSAAHMARAVGAFQQQGAGVIPAPTGYTFVRGGEGSAKSRRLSSLLTDILPTADNLKTTTRMLKEYIGLLTYKLLGWI